MTTKAITRQLVSTAQRIKVTADLFGIHFPMRIEPCVYALTDSIASEYNGAYWEFYTLSNVGFYMAPVDDMMFDIACENGYEGKLSADALGITACLYAYSHLSFSDNDTFVDTYAKNYHLLREFMLEHKEVGAILRAID